MRELPILFSTPMVQAILEGRKTMTRRVCKDIADCDFKGGLDREPYLGDITLFEKVGLRKWDWVKHKNQWLYKLQNAVDGSKTYLLKCPYGQPGDRLYVKENAWIWCKKVRDGWTLTGKPKYRYIPVGQHVVYQADHPGKPEYRIDDNPEHDWRMKVARFMPHWASRITLDVVSRRVERVQEITEEDARAEGVMPFPLDHEGDCWTDGKFRTAFNYLWNQINGWNPNSWEQNPFCWVIEFNRVKGGQP